MDEESQHPIAAIEAALVEMRRDQQRGRLHRGGPGGPGGRGGTPPWGDGPPPWARGERSHGHDRSLGGAARFRLLDALVAAEASEARMGISEIAEAISVDQPRASRLVNEAAERGIVTRRADERDARRSVVELTDAGRAMLESARSTRRSAVTEALAGFTPDEMANFAQLLSRFVAAWPR
jgi:DNA-binding MarR family transcriptional regulator